MWSWSSTWELGPNGQAEKETLGLVWAFETPKSTLSDTLSLTRKYYYQLF